MWGHQAADNLSPLVTVLYIFSFCRGHESSEKQEKIFCEEMAFRIKMPLESNYMFNNLRYYFRRYKTERTAYCLLLTSSLPFFPLPNFFSLKVPICFGPEPVLVKCLNSTLYTVLITEHCFFLLHFYNSWLQVCSLGYIYSVTLGSSTCS